MTLVIQTNVSGRLSFWLVKKKVLIGSLSKTVKWHGSDVALQIIDALLTNNKKKLNDITHIVVVRGPGSFTAVRTGLIIANTLGSLYHIPIHGMVHAGLLTEEEVIETALLPGTKNTLIKPWYGKSPNITVSKKKSPQARAKR